MAKTIKFNLICDNKPIRTIEDLQDNFSIEDILKYYENGLLLRWLHVRGYQEEEKKVAAISCKEDIEIVKALIRIFNIETDEKKMEENVYILQFLKEDKKLSDDYRLKQFEVQMIVENYHQGYGKLVEKIMEYPNDMAKIKAVIVELVQNYGGILALNYKDLFWKLKDKSMVAIMCLLMNENTRKYYLDDVFIDDTNEEITNYLNVVDLNKENKDRREIFAEICRITKTANFVIALGDNLRTFSGVTDGYWKDLEPKGKKYMIISMGTTVYVRASGECGGDLGYPKILDNFVIIDGIDYKSNSESAKLLYMEV